MVLTCIVFSILVKIGWFQMAIFIISFADVNWSVARVIFSAGGQLF